MSGKTKTLSKTRIMAGLQCEKLLWLSIHKSKLARKVTPSEQARFDAGNEVGEAAQKRFPGGVLIDAPYYDRPLAIAQTNEALELGKKIIYEAAVEHEGLWAKIDILRYQKGAWDLIEVKSTTSVKEIHHVDVAIQAYILMHQGLPMGQCYLMHLNRDCRYPKLNDLFIKQDITSEVEALIPEVEDAVTELKIIAGKASAPEVPIGPHCNDPYDCAFMEQCWGRPQENSVFDLPRLSKAKAWDLMDQGITKITQLDEHDYKGITKRAIEVVKSKKDFVDQNAIKEELSAWQWPLYFFDFETLADAIPRFKGIGPYKQVPFQYSCHVLKSPKSKTLEHFEYLHTEASDPREAIAKSIVKNFGQTGSVVAYNKSFEKGVLERLAEDFPKLQKPLNSIIDRLVDPLPIFRNHVYSAGFRGSFSIKAVGPTLVGEKLSYDSLEVSDGSEAQAAVNALMRGRVTDPGEREVIAQGLLDYCRQDTMAMVDLVQWLMAEATLKG